MRNRVTRLLPSPLARLTLGALLGALGCGQVAETPPTSDSSTGGAKASGGAPSTGGGQTTGGTTSGGSSGTGASAGNGALCDSLETTAEETIASEIAKRSGCSDDEECVQTKLSGGCSRPCGLIVNESGADEMPGVIEAACAEYRDNDCPKVVYPCLVPLLAIPVCREGTCTGEVPK